MHFIEEWFGISPDNGSGALESVYFIVVGITVALILFRRQIARAAVRRKRG
jgi:hypothetical protein